jgi:tetratricopeptide (TPR) repeat protein
VEAWGALSRANSLMYANTTQADSFKVAALAAAQHAMQIDSTAVDGVRALGVFYRSTISDNERARDYLQRAVRAAPQDVNVLSDLANALSDLGELEPALRTVNEARALDPRNARVFQTKARILVRLRRPSEAAAAADSGLVLTSSSLQLVQLRLMADLSAGDLTAARNRLATLLRELPRDRVLTQLANYWDMGWVLEGADERDLMALGEEAFGGGRTSRASIHAVQFAWRGDTARARAAADTARTLRAADVAANPSDPQRQALLALAEAHAGRSAAALAVVKHARALLDANPASRRSLLGTYTTYSLARAALAAGDTEQAFALLAEAMQRRYLASPAWVRLDPSWQSVLRDPGFVRALGS